MRQALTRPLSHDLSGPALALLLAALLAGCGHGSTHSAAGEGACAFIAHFQGRVYRGVHVEVAPIVGRAVGTAVIPACNDTIPADPTPQRRIPVAELPGVSPAVALALRGGSQNLLVRQTVADKLPPQIARLLRAPGCNSREAPITLRGPWLGIQPSPCAAVDCTVCRSWLVSNRPLHRPVTPLGHPRRPGRRGPPRDLAYRSPR